MEDFNTASTSMGMDASMDTSQLTCQQQLDLESVNIGYATEFDEMRGMVYIIGGEACWEEVLNVIQRANEFADEQVQRLAEQGINIEDMGLPYDTYKQVVDMVGDYTDGTLLVSGWSWRHSTLEAGDAVGVCFGQDGGMQENNASCWAFSLRSDGEYKDENESYLIPPSQVTETSRLTDWTDKSNEMLPGLFGSWMCMPPLVSGDMAMTSCLRMMPSREAASAEDPRFEVGPVSVTTYDTSRNSTDTFNGNSATSVEESNFEFFQLNLMGASNLHVAAMALAGAVVLMNF